MDKSPERESIVSFGSFKLDVQSAELRRNGTKTRLQEQPFQILLVLLSRSGEVVTREELQSKLWAADTFVDFDNGLNIAVKKLRSALGDDAEAPQYIETLPRRGYRFLVGVTAESPKTSSQSSPATAPKVLPPKEAVSAEALAEAPAVPVEPAQSGQQNHRWKLAAAAFVVIALIAAAVYFYRHRSPVLTEKDTIVLADFTNTTGDSVFDGTLRQGLEVQLKQSPFLNILSDRSAARTLATMDKAQSGDARLTPGLAREVCQRTSSVATLESTISSLGSEYVLGLKAVDCRSGNVLAEEQITANSKEQVLMVLGEAASRIRLKLGESLPSLQKFDVQLDEGNTPSLEALRAFTLGNAAYDNGDFAAAASFFQHALALDPKFAMAYARLGATYSNLGETHRAAENFASAYALRERSTERGRFYIDAHYQTSVTGDMVEARETYELWAQTYTREAGPHINLAYVYSVLGQYGKAHASNLQAFKLNPDSGIVYANLVADNLNDFRPEEAKAIAREAQAKKLDLPVLPLLLYRVAFTQNDAASMASEAALAMEKRGVEDKMLFYESQSAAYAGQFGKARELTDRAAESANRAGQKESAAAYQAEAAVREALAGNAGEAKRRAATALRSSTGSDVTALAGIALARSGEVVQAGRLADDLAKRFPEDTVVQFDYLPMIRAYLALQGGRASDAVASLVPAAPYELGRACPSLNFNLYPIYVRGEAYLAAGEGQSAAAEFQKILDHPGLVVNEPIGALSHLGLARAYAIHGDTAKAKAAYLHFLELWKDADPQLPILTQVKAEHAKLQ
jgi:DNA-binding winged helix-turn-helix (wHTH) protein/tetratricopeptide (TPR) repeat protein